MCAVKSGQGRKSRLCRAFRLRTVLFVERSVASWQAIFGRSVELPLWDDATTCSDLAGLVKAFLGRDVSNIPREQLSFQSIKKGLPPSCKCMERGLLDKLVRVIGSPPRSLPAGYSEFLRREVSELFFKGWDAQYEGHCCLTSPPLSSVYVDDPTCPSAGSRATGGALGWTRESQSDYLDRVLHGNGEVGSVTGKLIVVQSAGKPRPLSKFETKMLDIKPLHKSIYGHMKRFSWLLVGPPTSKKLRRAGFRRGGGSLVSGDYASATDGLSIEAAEIILETLMSKSVFVPQNVKDGAMALLRPLLLYGESDSVRVSTGQMMGSLLSFPLLCLQNYLAFRWSLRGTSLSKKRVPVLINGDDILFQLSGHYNRWERTLSAVGLTVEKTKTSVDDDWGTINSTLVEWDGEFLTTSWSARFGMFRPAEHPGALGRTFASFLDGCDEPDVRFKAGREFFRWHVGELRSSGVSPVSLGFRGLLARRLSKVFHLLELPLSEYPSAFRKHDVGYDAEFIERLDIGAFSEEELRMNALELGSEKWARGWRPLEQTREAVLYCLRASAARVSRFDWAFDGRWFGSTEDEFRFMLKNLQPLYPGTVSSKAFLQPFPPPDKVLVSWWVLRGLSPLDGEFDTLPAYTVEDAVRW